MREMTSFGLGTGIALLALFGTGGLWIAFRHVRCRAWLLTAVLGMTFGLIFSRLLYVAVSYHDYLALDSLRPVLVLQDGGFSLMGGLGGLLLGGCLAGKITGTDARELLDGLAAGFLPAVVIIRFFEQGTTVGIGKFTAMFSEKIQESWFVIRNENDELVFAVFRMEAVATIVMFLALLCWLKVKKDRRPGDLLLWVLTVFGAVQACLASLHNDYHMMVYFFQGNELLAVILILAAMIARGARLKGKGYGKRCWICWGLFAAAVGLGVLAEFRMDRGEHKLLSYGLLMFSMALAAGSSFALGKADPDTARLRN